MLDLLHVGVTRRKRSLIKIRKWINKIHQGHALEILRKMPSEFVNCIVTSPPYWALRDYQIKEQITWGGAMDCDHIFNISTPPRRKRSVKDVKNPNSIQAGNLGSQHDLKETQFCSKCGAWKGNLGLEPTFDLYIKNLCDIFDEAKRVLRKDGTCWVNIGDTYSNSPTGTQTKSSKSNWDRPSRKSNFKANQILKGRVLQDKSLVGIPFRFALEMINRGWILRNTIIWHKPNCMPSSAKDRFTVDFEYIFFFVKSKKYFFETQYEKSKTDSSTSFNLRVRDVKRGYAIKSGQYRASKKEVEQYHGQNIRYGQERTKRTVWNVVPQSLFNFLCKHCDYYGRIKVVKLKKGFFSDKDFEDEIISKCPSCNKETLTRHFAVFPEELIETPIQAGCPEFVCKKCGKPRERKFKYLEKPLNTSNPRQRKTNIENKETGQLSRMGGTTDYKPNASVFQTPKKQVGWKECTCKAGFIGGVVLDMFMGTGTTWIVALKQNKRSIGIEISKESIKMTNARLKPYLEQERLS